MRPVLVLLSSTLAASLAPGCASQGDDDDSADAPIVADDPTEDSVWENLSLGFNVTLNAVWASSDQDIWIVGDGGQIFHWTGTNWTATPSGTVSDINAVWGADGGQLVVAVGDGGTVLRWNGTSQAWERQEFDFVSNLTGVQGFAEDDVYVTGYGGLFHWDGEAWSAVALPENVPLRSIWGSSPADLWIAGEEGVVLHGPAEDLAVVPTGETRSLNAIRGSGNSIWVAGQSGLLLRYDGSQFVPDDTFEQENHLWAVWTDASVVFTAGANGHVLRWAGSEWEDLETGDGVQVVLYGLFAFGAQDVYAVGGNGTVLHYPKAEAAG